MTHDDALGCALLTLALLVLLVLAVAAPECPQDWREGLP